MYIAPLIAAAGITAGAGLLGGILGNKGASDANAANANIANARNAMEVAEAKKNREFQDQQALRQMNYQERMANTAVTRRMADLKKAGINPILAGKYDAASPGGAAAGGSKANAMGYNAISEQTVNADTMMNMLSTAVQLKKLNAEANNAEATGNIKQPMSSLMTDIDTGYKRAKHMLQTGAKDPISQAVEDYGKATRVWVGKIARETYEKGKKLTNKKTYTKGYEKAVPVKGWDKNGVPQY